MRLLGINQLQQCSRICFIVDLSSMHIYTKLQVHGPHFDQSRLDIVSIDGGMKQAAIPCGIAGFKMSKELDQKKAAERAYTLVNTG